MILCMYKKTSKFILICVIFVYALSSFAFASDLGISSKGACIIDYETGDILYGYNETLPLVPASITKLITVYCVYDAVNEGRISFDDVVPVSKEIEKKCKKGYYEDGYMLYSDSVYTVDKLLDAALVCSVNASAVVLAEYIAGSEEEFVLIMRDTMNKIGVEAEIYDCYGISDKNRISSHNVVKLARRLIKDYPEVLKKTTKKNIELDGKIYDCSNHLLDKFYYEGADGLKTGTTSAAGACLCSTAVRDGNRIISVTMFSKTRDRRFSDSAILLDYGFKRLHEGGWDRGLYSTDIDVYFDSIKIPSFYVKYDIDGAAVKCDDMVNWGFDLSYSDETRTLFIKYNPTKEKDNLSDCEFDNGMKISNISDSDIKVALVSDGLVNYFKNTYNSENCMYISIDELAGYFDYSWDSVSKTALFSQAS